MTDWPRTILPQRVTDFSFPGALVAQGQSGKATTRDYARVGRTWTERYLVKVSDPDARAFMALIRKYWREGTVFDIDHRDYLAPLGAGGGTPLVNGTLQTGSNLVVSGGPASTTGWILTGDVFRITGLNITYEAAGDVNTNATGGATIPISPSLYTGGSPTSGATLTITGVKVRARIANPPEMPESDASDFGVVTVHFIEAP